MGTQQHCVQFVMVPGITRTPPTTHVAALSLHLSLYKMSKIKIIGINQGGKPRFLLPRKDRSKQGLVCYL